MDLQLQHKIILVNGDGSDAVSSLLNLLAGEGAIAVLVLNKHGDDLRPSAGSRPEFTITADLHDPAACRKCIHEILHRYGAVHGFINYAPVSGSLNFRHPALFMPMLETELLPYFNLTQAVLPAIKQSKGTVLNMIGSQPGSISCAGALKALTREWAVELVPFSIRVNAIIAADLNNGGTELRNREMAASAAFLLSACSGHTTGQLIYACDTCL